MFGQPTSPRFRAALAGTLSAGLVFGLAACGGSKDSGGSVDGRLGVVDRLRAIHQVR